MAAGGFWFGLAVRKTSYRGAKANQGIKAPECQRYHVSSIRDGVRDDVIQTVAHIFLFLLLLKVGECWM